MVSLAYRSQPPKHYTVSIKSFSSLASDGMFESGEFDVGGYKWKLVLFPSGNKNRGVKDHISLYIMKAGKYFINPSKIVTVTGYKFFLLNRHMGNKKRYMFHEESYNKEEEKYCIYGTIIGGLAGVDRFISLEEFNDPKKGYLVDDRCEFGVEVFVSEKTLNLNETTKGECLFMSLNHARANHTWIIADYSKVADNKSINSGSFNLKGQWYCAWKLELYPKGYHGIGTHASLFLHLSNGAELPCGSRIRAEFTLRVLDRVHGKHCVQHHEPKWFLAEANAPESGAAFYEMVTKEEITRLLVNDSCTIELELSVVGVSMPAKY